ncbi:MAG: thioredoxin-disulfide reductase [Candidatus Omnitrophota bacterium]
MDDVIIIGCGPAGLTAALYCARFKLKVRVFEKLSCGGQILLSPTIENYPGFPGGIATFELMDKFQKQVENLGVKIESVDITALQEEGGYFKVSSGSESFLSKTVIISTGATSKQLGVLGEDKLTGKGVSYCGTCDGPLFKDKEVVVVGGGDRALEDAIFLSEYASKIALIHRRNEFRASGVLVDKAKKIPKISFVLDSVVEEICGEERVKEVRVKNVKSGLTSTIACQGVFIFVGILPNTGLIKDMVDTNELGFIHVKQNMQTSKEGIFACGDCVEKSLYQVINACGEGAVAADSVHKYLLNQ